MSRVGNKVAGEKRQKWVETVWQSTHGAKFFLRLAGAARSAGGWPVLSPPQAGGARLEMLRGPCLGAASPGCAHA